MQLTISAVFVSMETGVKVSCTVNRGKRYTEAQYINYNEECGDYCNLPLSFRYMLQEVSSCVYMAMQDAHALGFTQRHVCIACPQLGLLFEVEPSIPLHYRIELVNLNGDSGFSFIVVH